MFAAPGDVLKEHFAKELDVICEIVLTAITGTRGVTPEMA
jgi:plasmid maintenance system antidote protein VapI